MWDEPQYQDLGRVPCLGHTYATVVGRIGDDDTCIIVCCKRYEHKYKYMYKVSYMYVHNWSLGSVLSTAVVPPLLTRGAGYVIA